MSYEKNSSRGKGSKPRYHQDRGHDEENIGRHASRRSVDSRHYDGADGFNPVRERNSGYRQRHRSRKIELQSAISNLFDILGESHCFYEDFNHKYDAETRGIREYAEPEILDRLWILKAKTTRRSIMRNNHGPSDEGFDHSPHGDDPGGDMVDIRSTAEEIHRAFEVVMNAAPPSHRSKSQHGPSADAEGLSRMMKKLDVAFREMSQLSRGACKRRTHLQELLKEIDLVLGYLDKSRNLWQPDSDRDNDGASSYQNPHGSDSGNPGDPQDPDQCEYHTLYLLSPR